MPKLRMKNTPEDLAKTKRKAERKRRRDASPAASTSKLPPSRTTRISYSDPFISFKSDKDESAGRNAREEENDYENDQTEQDRFQEKLRDAMDEDSGNFYQDSTYRNYEHSVGGYEAGGYEAGGYASGIGSIDGMSEEGYAEFIRRGIYERTHGDEIAREKERIRLAKVKEVKETLDRAARDRVEKIRIKKLEERIKVRSEQERAETKKNYDTRWKALSIIPPLVEIDHSQIGPHPHPNQLRFDSFVWPVYPPIPFPPLSWPKLSDITPSSIAEFIFPGNDPNFEGKKKLLRSVILSYHPDRFDRFLVRIGDEKTRERVKALGLKTSQTLNDLLKEF